MQLLYSFSAACSADSLPEIKKMLDLDENKLKILEIVEMFHVHGENHDEARMIEKLPTLKESKCFCYIWENAEWSAADSASLSSLCDTLWKPCLKAWELLVFKICTLPIKYLFFEMLWPTFFVLQQSLI